MEKLITRLIHRLPNKIKNVWYNQSHYIDDKKFPIIFDEKGNYIDCRIGDKVIMMKTKDNRNVYYEVTSIKSTRGSDWLYPSDCINCDLKFSHIEK